MPAPAPTPPPSSASERLWQIDALRGLMLVLMTLTHLPTRLSSPLGQPFGFVSAAEGFVFLSAFMAGMVYTRRQQREGDPVMREAFLKRALKIYLCQAALLLFLFSVVTLLATALRQESVLNLVSFYLEKPLAALFGSLLLIYNPPLFDILPMYIVFMLVSPVLLVHGLHQGWLGILAVSAALWLAAQFGLAGALLEGFISLTKLPVPPQQTGSFDILAWQLLWVIGLWQGAQFARGKERPPLLFPRWLLYTALAVAGSCFVWRHAVGQLPFFGALPYEMWFDKWQLGPLRVINLFALLILTIHFEPWLRRTLPRWKVLETLGAASLPVFCAHLVLALLALALAGEPVPGRPWTIDALIVMLSFAVLYTVALFSQEIDRQAAAVKAKLKSRAERRKPVPAPPGAGKWPPSRSNTPRG